MGDSPLYGPFLDDAAVLDRQDRPRKRYLQDTSSSSDLAALHQELGQDGPDAQQPSVPQVIDSHAHDIFTLQQTADSLPATMTPAEMVVPGHGPKRRRLACAREEFDALALSSGPSAESSR